MKAYGIRYTQVMRVILDLGYQPRLSRVRGRDHDDGFVDMATTATPGVRSRRCCAHEYAEALEAILRRYPETTLETALTTYYGLEDFEKRKEQTLRQALARFPCRVQHPEESDEHGRASA